MFMKSRHDGGGGQSDSSGVVGGGRRRDIGEKNGKEGFGLGSERQMWREGAREREAS